jgi:hypothetical protein
VNVRSDVLPGVPAIVGLGHANRRDMAACADEPLNLYMLADAPDGGNNSILLKSFQEHLKQQIVFHVQNSQWVKESA